MDTEYSRIFRHEKRLSYVFTYIMPIIIIILLIFANAIIHDSNLKTPIMVGLPFLNLIFFWIIYDRPTGRKNTTDFIFTKIGYEKLAIRYVILRRIYRTRCVEFLIYALVFTSFMYYLLSTQNQNNSQVKDLENLFASITFIPIIMILALSLHFSILNRYNDFHYYFAKASMQILKTFNNLDDIHKSPWIMNCLFAYNRYLRINQNFTINNMEKVFSKIISESVDLMNQRIDLIFDKLTKGEKLDLLRYILELTECTETKPIIFSQRAMTKIKELIPIIIPVLSLAVAAVELFKR